MISMFRMNCQKFWKSHTPLFSEAFMEK